MRHHAHDDSRRRRAVGNLNREIARGKGITSILRALGRVEWAFWLGVLIALWVLSCGGI